MKSTYDTHRRRAIEPDGTSHAARYAGDRAHFTLACALYPMPAIERLVHDGEYRPVTCPGCRTALDVVVTCPRCKTPGAQFYCEPIPHTDDFADCARCIACRHTWVLDGAADAACTRCGGSGRTGRGTLADPECTCGDRQPLDATARQVGGAWPCPCGTANAADGACPNCGRSSWTCADCYTVSSTADHPCRRCGGHHAAETLTAY